MSTTTPYGEPVEHVQLRHALFALAGDNDNLSVRQTALLLGLAAQSFPCTVKHAALYLGVHKSVITRSMKSLVSMSLTRKERSIEDGRVVFMRVTPIGKKRVAAIYASLHRKPGSTRRRAA